MRILSGLLSLVLSISAIVGLEHQARDVSRVHQGLARRMLASNATDGASLSKRAFTNARATHYEAGLGACGKYNTGADFIVALNHVQFGSGYPGPNCFRKIRISYKGISAVAEIRDMCPGCDYGMLDLTNGLFSHFVPLHTDVFYMSWEFIDGDSEPDPPKSTAKPKPKPTQKPSPTSTKHSTSTHKPSSTHSSSHKPTSSSHTTHTTTASTSTPTPTPTVPPTPQNVPVLQQAVLGMANLLNAHNVGN